MRHEIVDGPLGTLDQARPLHERSRSPLRQRFREIARELWLTLLESHAHASLDELGRQALARAEPVEGRVANIRKAACGEPLRGDGLFEAVVAAERCPGGEGVTAQGDIGVDGIPVVLEVSRPLLASAELRKPRPAQAAE